MHIHQLAAAQVHARTIIYSYNRLSERLSAGGALLADQCTEHEQLYSSNMKLIVVYLLICCATETVHCGRQWQLWRDYLKKLTSYGDREITSDKSQSSFVTIAKKVCESIVESSCEHYQSYGDRRLVMPI